VIVNERVLIFGVPHGGLLIGSSALTWFPPRAEEALHIYIYNHDMTATITYGEIDSLPSRKYRV
jgi:hypothetical protein